MRAGRGGKKGAHSGQFVTIVSHLELNEIFQKIHTCAALATDLIGMVQVRRNPLLRNRLHSCIGPKIGSRSAVR